ncbi:hypothetical protein L204_103693 [Cryptococcus depauperatus]
MNANLVQLFEVDPSLRCAMPPQSSHLYHSSNSRYGAPASQPVGVRAGAKQPSKLGIDSLPSMDKPSYYDPPSPCSSSCSSRSASPSPPNLQTNSGNKLVPGAQFMRRGKMYAWGPSFETVQTDRRARKRLKLCLEQFMPSAAAEVNAEIPTNIVLANEKRIERKRKREEKRRYTLPHLRSPSPPMSTAKLSSLLALPQSYTDLIFNPAMRHSLGDATMEQGLQRTVGELLEGEKPLMQALGRLKDVVRVRERDVAGRQAQGYKLAGIGMPRNGHDMSQSHSHLIPPLPQISDTDNLWRVTQELLSQPGQGQSAPFPKITYSATPSGAAAPTLQPVIEQPDLVPTPLQRLFTVPDGITLHAIPNSTHPGLNYPQGHSLHPQTVKYNIDLKNQCRAVDDAWERVSELLADCNEYRERLEEARDRVADIARVRKRVWRVIKERAGWELEGERDGKQ